MTWGMLNASAVFNNGRMRFWVGMGGSGKCRGMGKRANGQKSK
jgi:hypothetical protein